jgi:hypothetical protein
MFRTSGVNPKGESFVCNIVCFTCIGVSRLVGRRVRPDRVGDIRNLVLIYKIVCFDGLCCVSKCTVQKTLKIIKFLNMRNNSYVRRTAVHYCC